MTETLTIAVPSAIAATLRSKAASRGIDVGAIAEEMLVWQIESETAKFDPATLAAIREGIADGEAGREQPLEDYIAEMQAERAVRAAKRSRISKVP